MAKPKTATAVLTLTVAYDLNGVDKKEMEYMLEGLVERAAGYGGMTGDTEATVATWGLAIKWK